MKYVNRHHGLKEITLHDNELPKGAQRGLRGCTAMLRDYSKPHAPHRLLPQARPCRGPRHDPPRRLGIGWRLAVMIRNIATGALFIALCGIITFGLLLLPGAEPLTR